MNDYVVRQKHVIDDLCHRYTDAYNTLLRLKSELREARRHYEATQQAQEIAQAVAAIVQQQAHERIAGIVSKCLATVFDEPYEFRINFEQKRGKTDARLVFLRDGHELDPMEDSGLGVVDVAAFALRVAALVLTQPMKRRMIVMDEPMKFVSRDYQSRVRTMLQMLSEELDVQIVLVTHIEALQIGKVVEL
jgi:DNA repair exonuclease SbcCD ATPase subunit